MNVFVEEYHYYLKGELNLSENTVNSYLRDVKAYVDFITNHRNKKHPDEIEITDIRNYLSSLKRQFLKSSSITRKLSAIKSFHRFLFLEKYTTRNISKAIKNPKQEEKIPIVLSTEEVKILFDSLPLDNHLDLRNKAMIAITYACGLRVSELINLKLSDLHFDNGVINVLGKGNKERIVPINQEAITLVNNYLEKSRVFLRKNQKSKNFLFLNSHGAPISRISFYNILKQAGINAGLRKKITPHMLRHSCASHLLANGLDLRLIQEFLGHEDISTTEIYTHIYNKKIQEVYLSAHPRARKGQK